jgi:FMN phosphatase YigB (HAD superfamily)
LTLFSVSGELNVQPNETVLVGDDPIADKQGAMAVGIDAWFAIQSSFFRVFSLFWTE